MQEADYLGSVRIMLTCYGAQL